jgi:hypothetical protein
MQSVALLHGAPVPPLVAPEEALDAELALDAEVPPDVEVLALDAEVPPELEVAANEMVSCAPVPPVPTGGAVVPPPGPGNVIGSWAAQAATHVPVSTAAAINFASWIERMRGGWPDSR